MGLMETITRALLADGRSRYRIAQESGLSEAQLSRLVNSKVKLSVASTERLADVLGLQIVVQRKSRKGGKR